MSSHVSAPQAIRLVAGREIDARLRSRSFLVITAVLVLAVVGTVLLFHFLNRNNAPAAQQVGVTANTAAFQQVLVAAGQTAGQRIHTAVVDGTAGERQVRDGGLAAVVVGADAGRLQVMTKSTLPGGLQTAFDLAARQIALNQQITALHGDPVAVERAVASASVSVRALQPVDQHHSARIGMASVIGILTYVMLVISVQLTGQGVVEEKANRIVELLLATIRPWELLAGKVLGIGVVTIVQVMLLAVAGAGAAIATGVLHLSVGVVASVAGWALLWYLLGYFLYALLIAAAASLVSRQEDLASVATPVTVVIIAAYLIGQTVVPSNPNGPAATALSLIPFFSPVVMPMRATYGVAGWQMAVAIVLTIVTLGIVAGVAGRIYRNAVLLTGSRVSLRTALALGR
ncbi:ABC transporter permease [Nocardia terpenica]|uniref:ABC transporter permease n=1 Tax=Nocardia terpenica TaxID=455432 RepID=UPI0018962ECC|nr:ABC transporter permease [Nocardia terpenica]MBF6065304.1 ABC transporter permease [Nocardia terpenica]MBF6108031.1 ABC transporter permease [Nocardia terpenica]MBF6115438.1 ABC transporter permease [Nocardia terpenica]MBF6121875.1 ABC transporter permease [Nocardia terpenica]MBF6155581.1 ABC transporter permease [Nocardia terpenica]